MLECFLYLASAFGFGFGGIEGLKEFRDYKHDLKKIGIYNKVDKR